MPSALPCIFILKISCTTTTYKKGITIGIITSCKRKWQLYTLCQTSNMQTFNYILLYIIIYSNVLKKKVIYEAKARFNKYNFVNCNNKGKAIGTSQRYKQEKRQQYQEN